MQSFKQMKITVFRTSSLLLVGSLLPLASIAGAQQATPNPVPAPAYHLEAAAVRHIRADYTFQVHTPKLTPQEWVLFAAMPPTLPGQQDVHVTMNHEGHLDSEQSPFRRPILTARVPVKEADEPQGITVAVTTEATLYRRKLAAGAPKEKAAPLDKEERLMALAKTPTEDFTNPAFLDWMQRNKLVRGAEETEIGFAGRAFLVVKHMSSYLYTGPFQLRQASVVCSDLRTDCGGFSVLFVSIMRANKIPARTLCGRWAKSAGVNQPMMQMHVKAEFWAEGVGWIPCDLSSAVEFDRDGNTLRYFGEDPGDFLVQHTDTDLRFDTVYFGEKGQAFLQRAAYWVRGAGTIAESRERETWKVEDLPLAAPARAKGE